MARRAQYLGARGVCRGAGSPFSRRRVAGGHSTLAGGLDVVDRLALTASLAVGFSSPRRIRRGLVLALCVSLALNLSLMVGLSYIHLVSPRQITQAHVPAKKEKPPEKKLEEYYPLAMEGDDRPAQQERQPVSTGEPKLDPRDLIRKTSVALDEPWPLRRGGPCDADVAVLGGHRPSGGNRVSAALRGTGRHAQSTGTFG